MQMLSIMSFVFGKFGVFSIGERDDLSVGLNDFEFLRCFGIFAGSTMLVNYVMVVTWLPAVLVLMHKYEKWRQKRKVFDFCKLVAWTIANPVARTDI